MPTVRLEPNELIGGRWRILERLAVGGFSAVYKARDIRSSEVYAVKIELAAEKPETVTKMEAAILLRLRGVSRHVCAIMGCGREEGRMHYLVMSLAGPNLDDLRRKRPEKRMWSSTVIRLAIQGVQAIQDLHEVGFVHRDVKPANFAIGSTETDRRTLYILDFGLARRYVNDDASRVGDIRPARESVGFRGTLRYCSLAAHYNAELGRQDDFWSLLYVLVDLRVGSLPWQNVDDAIEMGRMKRVFEIDQLVDDAGDVEAFEPMLEELKQLRYDKKPDYDWFKSHFARVQAKFQYPIDGPFEWEEEVDEVSVVAST